MIRLALLLVVEDISLYHDQLAPPPGCNNHLIGYYLYGGVADLCAGGPSIIILIHNICMAFNGLGKFNIVDMATNVNAAILLHVNNQ